MSGLNTVNRLASLYIVRYVLISVTSAFAYDILLTLPDEVRLVWVTLTARYGKKSLIKTKLLYLITRYTMLVNSIIALMQMIPIVERSEQWCRDSIVYVYGTDILVETVASGVVIYRLQSLWRFGRLQTRILLGVSFAFMGLVWSLAIDNISDAAEKTTFLDFGPAIGMCFSRNRISGKYFATWALLVVFDASALALLLLNALSRPRVEGQRLTGILYRDGLIFFLTVISMRLLNLVIGPVDHELYPMGIIFSGAMVTTVSSRALLGLFSSNDSKYRVKTILHDDELEEDI